MILKERPPRRWAHAWAARRLPAGAALAAALAAAALGAWLGRAGPGDAARRLHARLRHPVSRWLACYRAPVERLAIGVRHEDLQRLAFRRAEALESGVLLADRTEWVPGAIERREGGLEARLRLKGDWTDHLKGEKWSLRVRLKEGAVLGMRDFALQAPGTRNGLHEWVYHEALEREGVLAPRYDFVQVALNGRELGVYAIEEHFGRHLPEARRRREGPILRLDEEALWADRRGAAPDFFRNASGLQSSRASSVEAYEEDKLLADEALRPAALSGLRLLEGWRTGRLPAAKAFHLDRLARFYALSELLGAQHALVWHNLRFYYDPVPGRLEPVAANGDAGTAPRRLLAVQPDPELAGKLFADPGFRDAYMAHLARVSAPGYLEGLLQALAPGIERRVDVLRRDEPGYDFDASPYAAARDMIRGSLAPARIAQAYLRSAGPGGARLEAANVQWLPAELLGLAQDGRRRLLPAPRALGALPPAGAPRYEAVEVPAPPGGWDPAKPLMALVRLAGTAGERQEPVHPWSRAAEGLALELPRRGPDVGFPFLAVDRAARRVTVRPGRWRVERSVVVGPGWLLAAGPGVRLDLARGASILSWSPVELSGTEEEPVVLESSDGTGGGLAVMRAGGRSRVRHTRFVNLAPPSDGAWSLSGAVTFYESPVDLERCRFQDARGEDSLNLARLDFTMSHAEFVRSRSDAFDCDFCDGRLYDSLFVDSGNDALDVSGTALELGRVRVERAGDKGLSAGEMSRVEAHDLAVLGARIGVASKDVSFVVLDGGLVRGARAALAAYQKKAEFGGGSLEAGGVSLESVGQPFLVEEGSRVVVDGRAVPPTGLGGFSKDDGL